MQLKTLKIKPQSAFGTYPKGDTLFGQIVSFLYLNGKSSVIENYLNEEPKFIVSDMMPFGYVYKPSLPIKCFKTEDKKELRKRTFISLKDLQEGNLTLQSCKKIIFYKKIDVIKNSINRTTFTTDSKGFALYAVNEIEFYKALWIFVLVDDKIEGLIIDTIQEIGKFGFSKDANIGKGRFDVEVVDEKINFNIDSHFYMSISPTILNDENIEDIWYEPFTRFGKFGLDRAFNNAFKKPILMANSSAVVKMKNNKKYFGNSINNGFGNKRSFLQGYSIAIPINFKDELCLK